MAAEPRLNAFEYKMHALVRMMSDRTGENVSLSSLGKRAELSHATLGKWVKNSYGPKFQPNTESLKKLADVCGVSLDWLMSDDMPAQAESDIGLPELRNCRERLLRRRYPPEAINAALLSDRVTQATDSENLFDLAEAELSAQGYSARFDQLEGAEVSDSTHVRPKSGKTVSEVVKEKKG